MIKPASDYLLVEKIEEPVSSSGLVFTSPIDPQAPRYAKVVAVGPGRITENGTLILVGVEVGQTILMHSGAGTRVRIDGREYWAIKPGDIIGVAA